LFPQGTLPCQPVKVKKIGVFFGAIYFVALPFQNGLQYRNYDFKRLNIMNLATMCTILVTFGPETPEFTLLTIAHFATIRQKSAYHVKYLRISWTNLDLLYRLGSRIGRNDYTNVRLAVAQGTLLWQPVKFTGWSQTSPGRLLSKLANSLWRSTTNWPIVSLL